MKLPLIQNDGEATHKGYLGDGLYTRMRDGQIWLTSENGLEVLDAVALGPDAWAELRKWYLNVLMAQTGMEKIP